MKQETDEVLKSSSGYPTNIRDLALGLRTLVCSAMPDACETLDRSARIVGYGFGPGYADTICVNDPPEIDKNRVSKAFEANH